MTNHPVIEIDGAALIDRGQFHDTFASAFGFFDGYGRNMDAWVDCMGYLRVAEKDMRLSDYHVSPGETLTIKLTNCEQLREKAPESLFEFLECAAFVNGREIERGEAPLIAMAY